MHVNHVIALMLPNTICTYTFNSFLKVLYLKNMTAEIGLR